MSYKVYLPGSLNAVEWSQAVWKAEGRVVPIDDCRLELIHEVLLQCLPRKGLIVDAGSGTCKWPIYLRRLGYSLVGVEIDAVANAVAREADPDLVLVRADVRQLPLKAHVADGAMSLGVVEHNEGGPLEALRETHRILKPNGTLVLAVPYNNLLRRLLVNHLMSYVKWRRQRAGTVQQFAEYRFTDREVREFLQQAGFETVGVHPNDFRPPKNSGLWVDYNNLWFDAFPGSPQFVLPGLRGKLAALLMRWVPWFVCAEVVFVARAK